ncbi:MAG: PhoU domain-containing protein [Longimicrobiales bacterium]|jgi:phosphate uptake regulator
MFKELLGLLKSSNAIASMGADFSRMLKISHEITLAAGQNFFDEEGGEGREEIRKRDIEINKLERGVRKQVIAHLTLSPSPGEVPYCLLLMSIVKDVERIGDYAKNLAEVRVEGGAPVPDDDLGTELSDIRRIVEGTFARVDEVFASSDAEVANVLIEEGRTVTRRCDALLGKVARSDYDAATATSVVLGARYYKRIGAHLLNVLSGVVMPLHKLDYHDEP